MHLVSAIRLIKENRVVIFLALTSVFLHFIVNIAGGYGYFRDEFYYIACSEHLDWGYVDHPPLSILILWLNRTLLGDSLFALRFLPALASGILVFLTGLIVREFGGRKVAQALACVSVLIAPVLLAVFDFYSMNAFEPLFWMGAAYVVIRIINTGNQKLWLLFGVIAGIGLQNKLGMLFFGFALVAGLALSDQRRLIATKWFWLGGAISAVLFLPNILWQVSHDWPTLEFMQNAQRWKNLPMSPMEFISAQVLFQHPIALPVWLSGVFALFFMRDLRRYRLFGIVFLMLLVLFIVQRGKPYYLSPVFPVIIGAGAVAIERFTAKIGRKWLLPVYITLLSLTGVLFLPLALPVLPIEIYPQYAAALGQEAPKMENHEDTVLPQFIADRFGWREMVAEVAKVYQSLPAEDKAKVFIGAQNYGEAGAIDFFGGAYGLPKAISGHNNYWLWAADMDTIEVAIIVGGSEARHKELFHSVQQVGFHTSQYAMPYETNLGIYLCRDLKLSMKDLWYRVKIFI